MKHFLRGIFHGKRLEKAPAGGKRIICLVEAPFIFHIRKKLDPPHVRTSGEIGKYKTAADFCIERSTQFQFFQRQCIGRRGKMVVPKVCRMNQRVFPRQGGAHQSHAQILNVLLQGIPCLRRIPMLPNLGGNRFRQFHSCGIFLRSLQQLSDHGFKISFSAAGDHNAESVGIVKIASRVLPERITAGGRAGTDQIPGKYLPIPYIPDSQLLSRNVQSDPALSRFQFYTAFRLSSETGRRNIGHVEFPCRKTSVESGAVLEVGGFGGIGPEEKFNMIRPPDAFIVKQGFCSFRNRAGDGDDKFFRFQFQTGGSRGLYKSGVHSGKTSQQFRLTIGNKKRSGRFPVQHQIRVRLAGRRIRRNVSGGRRFFKRIIQLYIVNQSMKEILIPCAAHGTSYCKQRICRWRSPFEIGKGERTLFLRNQHSVKPDPAVSAGTGGNTDGIKFSWFKPDLVTGHSKQFQKFLRHFIVPDFKQSLDLRIPGDTQAEIASPVCAERISGKSPPVGFREFLLRFEAELQCKRLEIISETRCRIIMLFTADKSMISQFTAIQLRFQRFLVEIP